MSRAAAASAGMQEEPRNELDDAASPQRQSTDDGDNNALEDDRPGDEDLGSDLIVGSSDDDQYLQVGEAGPTEVVFVREDVTVWPNRKERIPGRLSLVKQHCVLFITWLPYSPGTLADDGSFHTDSDAAATSQPGRAMYAIHPIPITEVRSLQQRTPSWGRDQSVAMTLVSGVTLPPLHFQHGGAQALLAALGRHVPLARSASAPNTWLINDVADPLARSLNALDLGDVLLGGPPRGDAFVTWAPPTPAPQMHLAAAKVSFEQWAEHSDSLWEHPPGTCLHPSAAATTNSGTATAAAQGAVPSATNGSVVAGSSALYAAGMAPSPLTVLGHTAWRALGTTLVSIGRAVQEYSMRAQFYAEYGDWDGWGDIIEQSVSSNSSSRAGSSNTLAGSRSASASVSPQPAPGANTVQDDDAAPVAVASLAAPADLFLQQQPQAVQPASSEHQQPEQPLGADNVPADNYGVEALSDTDDFEVVDVAAQEDMQVLLLGRRRTAAVAPPLTRAEWDAMHDASGRLPDVWVQALRTRAWQSGLCASVRKEVWPCLLGLSTAGQTAAERQAAAARRRTEYGALCKAWQQATASQQAQQSGSGGDAQQTQWQDSCWRIDKDVQRTDRTHPLFAADGAPATRALRRLLVTYAAHKPDIGYSQGMSDLAAPLLAVLRDESEAFWAFAALMDCAGANFDAGHQGMHAQLAALRQLIQVLDPQLHEHLAARSCLSYYFAFRWLLVLFKREFKFDEVLRLWDALWAAPSPHMQLYLAAAVLIHHRRAILSQVQDFDGMLKLCIQLSSSLELEPLLRLAATLHKYMGTAGDDILAGLPVTCQPACKQ